jgi:tetratricopeptide (TPR) repeat protein
VRRLQRQFDLAEPLYSEALQLLVRARATASAQVGPAAAAACNSQPAAGTCLAVCGAQESTLGVAHPSVGATLHNLAGLYLQKRDYTAARDAYASALAKKEAALGRHHPEYAATLAQLAEVLRLQGRLDDAAALLRESADVLDAVGAGHTRAATARLVRLAYVLHEAGKFSEAVAVHRRLLQSAENAPEPIPAAVAQAQSGLADALCRVGRHDDARTLYKQSIALLDASAAAAQNVVSAASVRRKLADAELADGSADALQRAEQLLDTALPVLRSAAARVGAGIPLEDGDGVSKSAGTGAAKKQEKLRAAAHAFATLELTSALATLTLLCSRRGDRAAAAEAVRAAESLLQGVPAGAAREALAARLQAVRS